MPGTVIGPEEYISVDKIKSLLSHLHFKITLGAALGGMYWSKFEGCLPTPLQINPDLNQKATDCF